MEQKKLSLAEALRKGGLFLDNRGFLHKCSSRTNRILGTAIDIEYSFARHFKDIGKELGKNDARVPKTPIKNNYYYEKVLTILNQGKTVELLDVTHKGEYAEMYRHAIRLEKARKTEEIQRHFRILFRNRKTRRLKAKNEYTKENYKGNRNLETRLISHSFEKKLLGIADNKVARCILKLNKLGFLEGSNRNITIRRSDLAMTFMPAGSPTVITESGNWEAKGRQQAKYGKVIRKVLKDQVPLLKFLDKEIEELVNHIKAQVKDGEFEMVSGDDIRFWYSSENYADEDDELDHGTLHGSCMRDDCCQDFFGIYTDNPDSVKMLILKNSEGCLIGRAIIWNDLYMDRIYGSDSTITAFKTYAREKGLYSKKYQNSCNESPWITPNGGQEHIKIKVDVSGYSGDQYPYADTLYMLDRNDMILYSHRPDRGTGKEDFIQLRCTSGGWDSMGEVWDAHNERWICEDEARWCQYNDVYYNENDCEMDIISYNFFLREDLEYIPHLDRYINPEDNDAVSIGGFWGRARDVVVSPTTDKEVFKWDLTTEDLKIIG